MELVYYRLIFENQREYLIETDILKLDKFTSKILDRDGYITLKLTDISEPINIKTASLFSIQLARDGEIGSQTKKWKLL